MARNSPPEAAQWNEFAYRGRTFIQATVPRGDNRGQPFTVAKQLAERYEVKNFFASGGCGLLLKGRDLQTETDVLIKTTLRYDVHHYAQGRDEDGFFRKLKETRMQLQTERRVMVLLKNSGCNAIPNPNDYVFDWNPQLGGPYKCPDGGDWEFADEAMLESEPYLIMEQVDGDPASERIGRGIPERDTLRIMRQVCHVLKALHRPLARGKNEWKLVYQDLKPANVMVGSQSGAMLIDFGGCRLIVDGTLVIAGANTPGYCSPECDAPNLTPAADTYTVGSTMYHMLTGKSPAEFMRSGLGNTGPKHVDHREWDWTALQKRASTRTFDFVQRCLAERPDDRPPDGEVLFSELSVLLGTQ